MEKKTISFDITKEDFANALNQLRDAADLKNKVDNLIFTSVNIESDFLSGYGMCIDHEGLVVDLLEKLMHDEDGTISWWCWEADYGRDDTMKIFVNDQAIDVSTVDKLYDYLLNEANNKTVEDEK